MADISKIKLPDETEVNLKDAQAFANIENDGQGGSSYTITRRDGTTKQVTIPNVTTTDPGLMTASDKIKIDTIEQGAEVNQQAFSKIRITKGSAHTDLDADTKTDTLELIEGDNITLTPSAVSDAVTIHAKDTVYTLAQDATDGHIIILTNNDEGSTDHVQIITIPDNNTTYTVSLNESTNEIVLTDSLGNTMKVKPSNASTSLDGFMSKNDKSKLDGIASGAEVNQNAFSNVIVDGTTISADSKTDTLTFIAGSNITITPNAANDSITIASSYTNTTYELTQDATDGHKFTLSGSNGYTKTITIPDNNTTYTLSVGTGTDANQIVFTPSSGSATKITVPYATKALKDADGNVIKDTYAASFSISDHTITLKNKSGVSLGTVTVPDNNTTYTFAEGTTNKAFSVTPSGGSAQTVPIHGLGSASEKNFTTSVTSGSADLVTSGAVASAISTAIDNLPEPMIFKGTLGTNGTITSLPTASSSNEGWTYKVITAGTYASQAAKVGDMFVSAKIGSAYQWVYVPSGDDVEDTWRNIKVNGTEKLGTGISSGAVDFVDGDFINITYANNKITVSHADTSSQASVSNSGRTYIQSITLDGAGHVTKLTSATETVVNTDRYVNSASFADDTTASANSPVKMTLTRAGSDTATVTANIPKVSASSAGVAPKGTAVSSQSQSTKFLREDGTWSVPSYTVNTDTKVTSVGNHYSPAADSSAQLSASASGGTAAWSIDVVQGVQLQRDAKGHVVGVTVTSGKIPGNPNTNYYHKTGSWSGLTYTAGKVGSPDDLAFTIPTGTSATTVAVGNHTHSTTIATSTGTNQLTLSHGGKYAITTGGTSFVFTMPTDNNTDTNVTQTATNTNANYEVLFSGTADNTTRTEGARKYSNLTFNPSTGTLTTTKVVSANATLGVADIDTANITEDNVGNLIVTGAARFLNTINGSISGNAATASDSAKLNGYASDTSATNNTIARRTASGYIFAKYFNQSSSAETPTSDSFIIYANSDGYFRKSTVGNMKTAMSLNNVENKSSATIRGELTSANVTTALGYTPVNKAGDTMSGELINQQGGIWVQGGSAAGGNVDRMTLTAGMPTELKYNGGKRGLRLYSNAVAIADPYNGNSNNDAGWIRHIEETSNSSIFEIATGDDGNESIVMRQYNTSSAVVREAKILGADGATSFPVSVTAPKFIGNLQGTADNSDKVDGYHIYYDRYVSSTQLAQPTADTIWYVKVSTANWNSNIEVIQIRTGGNNRTGSHVLYTGSRGTKWWGYGQVYSHRGLSGVYKVISNSDDIYLRFDADCTSATIYTSFTPQTIAIVDSPSGAYYTEVPTYGGWYGNQITVDHIQTNNYITIQKQTVASSTFADTNPKIVFKNVDGSQSGSLTWTDYDSVQSPASLTLNGSQGGEYFIAPNIKATGSFYGNLSGNASTATSATTASYANFINLIASNEIRFGNKPSSAVDVYVNYQWADGTASAMINKYVFMNGNKTKCPVEASKFIGPLQGNADTATTATTATKLGTSTVGGTTTPIYLNAGVPTALSYTIAKSVPSDALFTDHTYNFSGTTFYSGNQNNSEHNANNIQYNGLYYYTSNGPSKSLGATSDDAAIFAQAYSTSWVSQIASDYRNGNLYTRGKNNGTWQRWRKVRYSDDQFEHSDTVYFDSTTSKIVVNKSTSAWDAQAYSQNGYADAVYVTFKPNQINMAMMIGLDSNPSEDANYNKIDYALYCMNNGKVSVYESGSEKSVGAPAYAAGDEFKVEYIGGYVRYYHNGTLLREVARSISGKLYMDSSFHGATSCIYDVEFGCTTTNTKYAATAGTATSATSATKATQDGSGNTITSTYFRYYGATSTDGESSLFTSLGTKQYNNALPDGLTSVYKYGQTISICGTDARFDMYVAHTASGNGGGIRYRSGWGTDKQSWRTIIDSATIGSQSVNYATSAGSATKATQDSDGNAINTTYLKKSGGTLTGAINTANGTYNNIGDDVAIGDINVAGTLGVKGLNGATGIQLVPYSGSTAQKISINGSGTMTITGTVASTFSGNLTGNVTGNVSGSSGSCTGNSATATNATNDKNGLQIDTNYLKLSGGTLTGNLTISHATSATMTADSTNPKITFAENGTQPVHLIYTDYDNYRSPAGLKIIGGASATPAWFEVEGSIYNGHSIYTSAAVCANTANSGSAGGLALYGTNVTDYGIAFRSTSNSGKHGYVQTDWAQYHYMLDSGSGRGWVFRNQSTTTNVASINTQGHMVLNGSLTLGGNATNTSGVRQVYNATTQSLDFIFVA